MLSNYEELAAMVLPAEKRLPGLDEDARLTPLFRGVWKLRPYHILPDTPAGTRVIAELPDGYWEGPAMKARIKGGSSADWFTRGPNGAGTVDARLTMETDDGALIYTWGPGRCDLSAREVTDPVVYGCAMFETAHERYRWLNRIFAVYRSVIVGDVAAGEGVMYDEYFRLS